MTDPPIYFTTDHRWRCCDHPSQSEARDWKRIRHKVWCSRRCKIEHATGYVCILDNHHGDQCRGYFF